MNIALVHSAAAAAAKSDGDAERLLHFNRRLLEQVRVVAAAHRLPGMPAYAIKVGAHLRHIIEHYDALLAAPATGIVDYDARPRERALETDPALACARAGSLQQRLAGREIGSLAEPLLVRGKAGVAGEFDFAVASSLGRELVFVASHAVHHFALLIDYCARNGIAVGPDFGKAPATVAHERALAPVSSTSRKETPCPPSKPRA